MPKSEGTATMCLLEKPIDKKVKRHSIHGMMEEENVIRPHQEIAQLSLDEKKFLLAVERGDVASTRRMLQRAEETSYININCVDPLGRSALLMAIDNENLEMVELLIEHRVETKDALLHAISEEFVEAVEVLLDHEETIHKFGEPHSWEALPPDTATFTPDITPLILAAHRDNYEIIKILLDRGAILPMPHDVRCGCDECVTSRMEDSLRHSRSRINAYRALASPSLIALSSKDPILTAFELSWELRRLSFLEHEFKLEYQELRKQCQDFATALLDHTRSSYELEVLLNHDPTGPAFEHGERMHLNRLKLAVKLRQKKPIFAYIIDNMPNLKGNRACSIIFQEFQCKSESPAEWTIKIHEGFGAERKPGSGVSKKILHVTDVHYDPEYVVGSLAKCKNPLCCQRESGVVEKPEDAAGYWGDYNKCDTPKHSMVNSLNHMGRVHNDLEYVYFTGDIMSHKVWSTSIDNNTKSMVTALEAFKEAFGDIPVFPIFGNHEPHPLNVWIPENETTEMSTQWMFDLVADLWTKWLPDSTKETIKKGGYYTVLLEPGFRVIAINSNVAYLLNWWLIFDDVDPFGQLAWMENVLYESEQNGESVHILSHVPSGEGYTPWATQFRRIVRRYSGTITGIFNGHTHKDEFLVYEDEQNKPVQVAWNGGSLTAFTNNNPNYRVFHVDNGNYEILDFDEYIFNMTDANLNPELKPVWFKLYSFKEAYGVENMQASEIYNLTVRMAQDKDKTLLKQYNRYKSREGLSSEKECNENCLKQLLCRALVSVLFDTESCDRVLRNWS